MLLSEIDRPCLRRAWARIDQIFLSSGLRLYKGCDFEMLGSLSSANGYKPLDAHFNSDFNSHGNGQTFWLALIDKDERLMGRVCARLELLQPPMTLTDLWRKNLHRYYPSKAGGKVELAEKQPRFGKAITGRIVYLGGTQVHADAQSLGLGGYLNQMAQIEALDEWNADFYFGWMELSKFKDGFWRNCGFSRAHFDAIRWKNAGPVPIDENLVLAGNDRDGVLDLIDRILDGHQALSEDRKFVPDQHACGT